MTPHLPIRLIWRYLFRSRADIWLRGALAESSLGISGLPIPTAGRRIVAQNVGNK